MRMLFFAHSGLRYLVLLVAAVTLLYLVYAVVTGKGSGRVSRILGSSFAGVLDLQVLLGVFMVAFGVYYPALLGHIFMMIGAAVVAHVAMAMAKTSPPDRTDKVRLLGVVVAILLVVGGVMSIGRSLFESGPPPM